MLITIQIPPNFCTVMFNASGGSGPTHRFDYLPPCFHERAFANSLS